jgi:hypothetical protein
MLSALPALLDRPATALLLHGSAALGLANGGSDTDVMALAEGAATKPGVVFAQQLLDVDGARVHVEYVDLAGLRPALLDELLLSSILDVRGPVTRISTARVLYDPEGVGAALIAAFGAWRPSEKVRAKLFGDCLGLYGDAVAAEAGGDGEVSELLSGVHYVSLKWQGHLLRRFGGSAADEFAIVGGLRSPMAPRAARIETARRWLARLRDELARGCAA